VSDRGLRVVVVGATGLVGGEIVSLLADREFPVAELHLYASDESAGAEVEFGAERRAVERVPERLPSADVVFLCASPQVNGRVGAGVAAGGALVIDLSASDASEGAPPVLGPSDVAGAGARGPVRLADPAARLIVAPLRALAEAAPIRRVVATVAVPASAFGRKSVENLGRQTIDLLNARARGAGEETDDVGEEDESTLAFRCAPQVAASAENVRVERQVSALLGTGVAVTVQRLRAPVFFGQLASVSVEMAAAVSLDQARKLLREAPSLILVEDPAASRSTFDAIGIDAVQVTGLRQDPGSPQWLHLWALSENVRQGAALPAVALAESLLLRH
jgi:aspartate-semialdehyde dehydrogenase